MKKIYDLQGYIYNLISDYKLLLIFSSISDFLIYAYVSITIISRVLVLRETIFLITPLICYTLILLAFASRKQVALTVLFTTNSIIRLYDTFAVLVSNIETSDILVPLLSSIVNAILAIFFLAMINYKGSST